MNYYAIKAIFFAMVSARGEEITRDDPLVYWGFAETRCEIQEA